MLNPHLFESILTYGSNRYRKIWNLDSEDSSQERRRIELIVAWKIIHELTHLGFSWANGGYTADGTKILTPAKYGFESGEFVEQAMLGGLASFLFDGISNQWNGTQKVIGLCITKPLWRRDDPREPATFAVTEALIAPPRPRFASLLPVGCETSPVRLSRHVHAQTSSPAKVKSPSPRTHREAASEPADADAESLPFGGYHRTVPSCGKRFWAAMEPRVLALLAAAKDDADDSDGADGALSAAAVMGSAEA